MAGDNTIELRILPVHSLASELVAKLKQLVGWTTE
jgi:hypothetical protein